MCDELDINVIIIIQQQHVSYKQSGGIIGVAGFPSLCGKNSTVLGPNLVKSKVISN